MLQGLKALLAWLQKRRQSGVWVVSFLSQTHVQRLCSAWRSGRPQCWANIWLCVVFHMVALKFPSDEDLFLIVLKEILCLLDSWSEPFLKEMLCAWCLTYSGVVSVVEKHWASWAFHSHSHSFRHGAALQDTHWLREVKCGSVLWTSVKPGFSCLGSIWWRLGKMCFLYRSWYL